MKSGSSGGVTLAAGVELFDSAEKNRALSAKGENTRERENQIISYRREVWKEGGETGGEVSLTRSAYSTTPASSPHAENETRANFLPGGRLTSPHQFTKWTRSHGNIASATNIPYCGGSSSSCDQFGRRKSATKLFSFKRKSNKVGSSGGKALFHCNIKWRRKPIIPWLKIRKVVVHILPSSLSSLPTAKMDHEDLMSELPQIEKLSNQERLRLAHKRRMLQLKRSVFSKYLFEYLSLCS